jgi:hypothetical protein
MKVICRSTTLTPQQRQALDQVGQTDIYNFNVGEIYTVLGLSCGVDIDGGALLHLAGPHYLLAAPLCLFDIVDPRPSRYWIARKTEHTLSLRPEALHIDYFQDRLSDGDPELIPIYRELCARMESEFDDKAPPT